MAESDPQQASGGEEKVGGGDVPEQQQQQEDFNPFSQAGRSILYGLATQTHFRKVGLAIYGLARETRPTVC